MKIVQNSQHQNSNRTKIILKSISFTTYISERDKQTSKQTNSSNQTHTTQHLNKRKKHKTICNTNKTNKQKALEINTTQHHDSNTTTNYLEREKKKQRKRNQQFFNKQTKKAFKPTPLTLKQENKKKQIKSKNLKKPPQFSNTNKQTNKQSLQINTTQHHYSKTRK